MSTLSKRPNVVLIFSVLFVALTAAAPSYAQKTPPAAAPVPPQIFSASKVFISNGGSDS